MSLLSVLSMLFQCGAVVCDDYKNSNIIKESKERAIKNNQKTYIDNHGREYDVKTGRRVTFAIDNGDKVYRDSKTWKILYNISTEERALKKDANRQEAVKKGKRFFYDPEKKLYCEITTGEYFKRFDDIRMDFVTRYSSIKDHRVAYEFGEGPTDEEINKRHMLYEKYKKLKNSSSNWIEAKIAEIEIQKYDRTIKEKYNAKRKEV